MISLTLERSPTSHPQTIESFSGSQIYFDPNEAENMYAVNRECLRKITLLRYCHVTYNMDQPCLRLARPVWIEDWFVRFLQGSMRKCHGFIESRRDCRNTGQCYMTTCCYATMNDWTCLADGQPLPSVNGGLRFKSSCNIWLVK